MMWHRASLVALLVLSASGCSEENTNLEPEMTSDAELRLGSDLGETTGGSDTGLLEIDASDAERPGADAERPRADAGVVPGDASDAGIVIDQGPITEADMAMVPDAMVVVDAAPVPDDPIEALFAEPTPEELNAIRADWSTWDVSVNDWTVLGEGEVRRIPFAVVSHRVDGNLHYGAVRYPADYQPEGSYPVLVVNHGGGNGVGSNVFGGYSEGCYREFFIVAASYRSEELRTGIDALGNLVSEGTSSVVDRDVSDVMALLSGVLANMPGADPQRVAAHGGSRGAGVTALLVVRDPRIRRAGVYYGATNHIHPDVKAAILRRIETGRPVGNPVNQTASRKVQAFIDGDLTFAEARQALVRGSAVFFAEDLPRPYHHHHGTADRSVPVAQGRALATRMTELGVGPPDFEYTEYEGGEHNPRTMPGSVDAIRELLCGIR